MSSTYPGNSASASQMESWVQSVLENNDIVIFSKTY